MVQISLTYKSNKKGLLQLEWGVKLTSEKTTSMSWKALKCTQRKRRRRQHELTKQTNSRRVCAAELGWKPESKGNKLLTNELFHNMRCCDSSMHFSLFLRVWSAVKILVHAHAGNVNSEVFFLGGETYNPLAMLGISHKYTAVTIRISMVYCSYEDPAPPSGREGHALSRKTG